MAVRWVGVSASGQSVIVVDAEVPAGDDPIVIISDDTWHIQKGDRGAAYAVLHQRLTDYVQEHSIDAVVVKASAVTGKGSATLGLLNSAEVRGVVLAATAGVCPVRALTKAQISKGYGDRNVDDYVRDDAFWAAHTTGGNLRKMSRETAMLLVAARNI